MNEEALKKALAKLLQEAKDKRALEDSQRKEKNEADRSAIFDSVGKDIGKVIGPYIDKLGEHSKMSAEELKRIISESVKVEVPQIDTKGVESVLASAFAGFTLPTPQVHVSVPPITVPPVNVKMPESMNVSGDVTMNSVTRKRPFPVLMVDEAGKPMLFPISGGGMSAGPGFPMRVLDESSNAIRVTGSLTVAGSNSSTNIIDSSNNIVGSAANPLNVTVVSGAATSTKAQIGNSDGDYSVANPLPTTTTLTLPVGQGDSATALRVIQAGDSVSSVYANNPVAQGDAATALRVVLAGNADSSVSVTSITGPIAQGDAASGLRVVIAGNSDASVVVNSGTLTTVTTVTNITNSIAAYITDSGGVGYNGSNPIPVTLVSGALSSTIAVGDTLARTADIGAAPLKVGGIARTTNPTAYADGDRSNFATDKLGRQLNRPLQVRDLIATAYVTLSTGTEATLLAGSAGNFLDLIYIMAANTSSAAQQLDIRAVTAGNIVMSLYIPANGTAGVSLPIPFPQDATGNNWTVDMGDVTNSNILISALFSKEL